MKKMSNYNNIYEEMVKEAYENIVDGFDKEAAPSYAQVMKTMAENGWTKDPINNKPAGGALVPVSVPEDVKENILKRVQKHVGDHKGAYGAGASALALAGIGTGAYKALKNKKKSQEEETAEKAAAYYEAAVMAKEAAEADYANACAYEDAALEILADLGYID